MLKKLFILAAVSLFAASANAGTIVKTASISTTTTNYSQSVTVDQFDDLGGTLTLTSIIFELQGSVSGSALAESMDGSATIVTLTLGATLELSTSTGDSLVIAVPEIDEVFNASAFDGSIDFGGTSGATYTSLSNTLTKTNTITSASVLSQFIGSGTISTTLTATGSSTGTGAGNLITQFSTSAAANVKITYVYTEPDTPKVSEPGVLAIFGAILGFIGFANRKRLTK